MLHQTLKYLVSADHVAIDYRFMDEPVKVEVRQDGCWATHHRLGCGKTYATPEEAIRHLFVAHGCTRIRSRKE